nr:EOG090X0DK3 [Leptodora kindtii]
MSESFTIQVADSLRQFQSNSPKSSPRGNRSPVVPRQDSTGTLKTTISLGKTPSIVHTGPFYLHKELPAGDSELTGGMNLMAHYNLEHSYNKFSGKKFKDSLSSFLPNLPGMIDTPGNLDNSSIRSVIDKPPIGGKELVFLNNFQLSGFRLHPGPLPEMYRTASMAPQKKKQKHKKHKKSNELSPQEIPAGVSASSSANTGGGVSSTAGQTSGDGPGSGGESYEKKHKKQKRHEDDKDRKKKKKEKKKKKQKHSPEHPGTSSSSFTGVTQNSQNMLPLL